MFKPPTIADVFPLAALQIAWRRAAKALAAVWLLTLSLGSGSAMAASPIDVLSYSGNDGPFGYYGYDDQSYSGSRTGGGYGQMSGGEGDLTDGLAEQHVGSGYWLWSPYVMWDSFSPTLVFDLGQRHDVDSAYVSLISYPVAAVLIPDSAVLRFSDDGSSWGTSIVRTFTSGERALGNDEVATYEMLLGRAAQGRFVELTLVTGGRWTGASEVSFTGTPVSSLTPVPEPSALALIAAGTACLAVRRRKLQL